MSHGGVLLRAPPSGAHASLMLGEQASYSRGNGEPPSGSGMIA